MTVQGDNDATARGAWDVGALARHLVATTETGVLHDFGDDDELNSLYDGQLATHDPERALDVVLAAMDEVRQRRLPPARYYSDLAADLVETALSESPWEIIGRIEQLARERADFASLLGGVWRSSMPKEVWERLCAVALPLPESEPRSTRREPRRKRFRGSHRVPRTFRRRSGP